MTTTNAVETSSTAPTMLIKDGASLEVDARQLEAEFHALTDPRDPPDPADVAYEQERLARFDADAAVTRRDIAEAAQRLGSAAFADYGPPAGGTLVAFVTDPHAHTLGGYLAAVHDFTIKYVVFNSEHEPIAVALWVAHAHLVDQFETSPILAITSAEMRSGKTRVLDVLELLVPAPFRVVTPSEAVVYTILSQRPRPTMLLDEADAIFGPRTAERYEGLRAILNSGNQVGTPVMRVKLEGRRREVDAFDVFGPKAIAGIGDLPPTVTDRSIIIRMKRRAPSEPVEKFRRRIAGAQAKRIVLDWSTVIVDPIADVPDELQDRAADSWEPLLAVADAAGGPWPSMGRLAAVALGSDEDAPASVGMRLLAEIQMVFEQDDHLATAELLRRLHNLEDAPWGEWYGAPLSGRGLAKLLGPYRVTPSLKRIHGTPSRGYFRADFTDAWKRYVSAPESVTSVTSVTPTAAPTLPVTDVTDVTDSGAEIVDAIQCIDYRNHQDAHRFTVGGWTCDRCHPEPTP
jgi:hypothetical protein